MLKIIITNQLTNCIEKDLFTGKNQLTELIVTFTISLVCICVKLTSFIID